MAPLRVLMPITTYKQFTIHYSDQLELDTLIDEIFKRRIYYVDLDTNTPRIIDAGAHIGLTTLYLHSLYPHGRFTCIEPNPANLALLQQNLEENGITNVHVIEKALAKEAGTTTFYAAKSFGVFSSLQQGGWTGDQDTQAIEVETMQLSSLLHERVDLLKLDIEGAETQVIVEAQQQLRNVRHIMIEFHQTKNHPQDKLLRILRNYYHTVEITEDKRKEKDWNNRLYFIEAY